MVFVVFVTVISPTKPLPQSLATVKVTASPAGGVHMPDWHVSGSVQVPQLTTSQPLSKVPQFRPSVAQLVLGVQGMQMPDWQMSVPEQVPQLTI